MTRIFYLAVHYGFDIGVNHTTSYEPLSYTGYEKPPGFSHSPNKDVKPQKAIYKDKGRNI
jgi:hypothetical protein